MKPLYALLMAIIGWHLSVAQVIINEGSNRNYTQVQTPDGNDPDGDYPDWIELYNSGTASINLGNYTLSDDSANLGKWHLPFMMLPPGEWALVFASGKDSSGSTINHWETAVKDDDLWRWHVPHPLTPATWINPGFNGAAWPQGKGGFGFGDADDSTILNTSSVTVYTRIEFMVADTSKIGAATLHMDYDDGFVAYLNGTEIARNNMTGIPVWNTLADNQHEALMYQGQNPEEYVLDIVLIKSLLSQGNNVLAVEVHNVNSTSSDLTSRAFLSFGILDGTTQFGPVPAWFSVAPPTSLHTNFKIDRTGETVFLSQNGVLADSLLIPGSLPLDHSIGRSTDGAALKGVFTAATPGATNNTQDAWTAGYEATPVISHAAGLYAAAITVTLTSANPAIIRYTLNGDTPGPTSQIYTGPITIAASTVLRARCFSQGSKLPSPVVTNTFIIGAGIKAGIMCISTDSTNLYGPTGIYDNWTQDWKKPCHIEYFAPQTFVQVFEQGAGIRIDGGAGGSRSNPQRSFRVEPGNGTLGDGDLQYALQPSRPNRTSYETFYLRNGSNQYLFYPCKDAIETKCMGSETNNTYAAYTPVQVYLNGQYWGYYELREKLDADYFKQHFGTDKDSLELLSAAYWYGGQLRAVEGADPVTRFNNDFAAFSQLNPQDSTFWQDADQRFDLTYYIDYICAQSWIANTDWPYNNIKIHRSPETAHRWRFSLIDLEWSLSPNGWTNSSFDHINFMLNYGSGYPYLNLWQTGMQNSRFHDYFINRYADLMNTAWLPARLQQTASQIYGATRMELPKTALRWGDPNVPVFTYLADFDARHQEMLTELSARTAYVRAHIQNNFSLPQQVVTTLNVQPAGAGRITISTVTPTTYPWSGTYFDGVPVRIEAVPNPGYAFDHWDTNNLISQLNNAVFLDTLTLSASFTAHFLANATSTDVTISEVNYNSEATRNTDDWIEFWNYDTALYAPLTGWYFTDSDPLHKFFFPAGTVIPANGRLVVARDTAKFAAQHPGVPFIGPFSFGLSGTSDIVRLYNHLNIAVAEVAYADSLPWPPGADGQGSTLELIDPEGDLNAPNNWFDGCIGGSPGVPYSPCADALVFSEINYASDPLADAGDWVELRNVSAQTIDVSGWAFKDGVDSVGHSFVLPAGTLLAPHANLVLAQDSLKFSALHPGVTNQLASFGFGLSSKGEWIRAYDATGILRLSVRYNDNLPWPASAAGAGYTLELLDSLGQMNSGTNWFAGCPGGSPGRHYFQPCQPVVVPDSTVTLSEINYHAMPLLDAGDWVELWNYDPTHAVDISGWALRDADSANTFVFPPNTTIPANGRLVAVADVVKFATRHPGVAFVGPLFPTFDLNDVGDGIRLYDQLDTLVAEALYSNTTPWPSGASGQGYTLELKDRTVSLNAPSNWFAGCLGGSPGAAYTPCTTGVVFAEINYASDPLADAGDWVELRNIGSQPADLSGWAFRDGVDSAGHAFVLPAGTTLQPHTNLVLAQDTARFAAAHPGESAYTGPFGFDLSAQGEWLRATDAQGAPRLLMQYGTALPWPPTANGYGYTLELKDSTASLSDANNWFAGCPGGSPGAHFSLPCTNTTPDGITETLSVFPNPTTGAIMVELTQGEAIAAILTDALGREVLRVQPGSGRFALSLEGLPTGLYWLRVQTRTGAQWVTVVKE